MAIDATRGVTQTNMTMGDDARNVKGREAQAISRPVAVSQEPSPEAKKAEAAHEQQRVQNSTKMLNDFMKHFSIGLQFKIEDGETIVKVMNRQTGEVIRQIPSEEAIRMSKALDTLQGLIIQQKV